MLFFKQERNPQRLYGILIIKIILMRVTLPHARYRLESTIIHRHHDFFSEQKESRDNNETIRNKT